MGNSDESSGFKASTPQEVDKVVATARKTFRSGRTKDIIWRKDQLRQLYRMIDENHAEIVDAVLHDFSKPRHESMLSEVAMNLNHIAYTLKYLDSWVKPDYPEKGLTEMGSDLYVRKEPFGVCLIIAPWNYPFDLILKPLTSAIAAGNAAVCKPSELTPHCAMLLADLVPRYLDPEAVFVVNGGVKETTLLLEKRWDHITYTGSTTVGKIVMAAASKFVTPVVLELGGKSPVIIDGSLTAADMATVGKRLGGFKFFNDGQTCIAPDYVLCPPHLVAPLADNVSKYVESAYGADPSTSPDLAKIINKSHTRRIGRLIDKQVAVSGTVVASGGVWDEKTSYVSPTILTGVRGDGPIMSGEIFGPVLPIVEVDGVDSAIDFVLDRERPLALYIFSKDKSFIGKILDQVTSGGVVVNDSVLHGAIDSAPFGGIGASGQGMLHGKYGFDSYSHHRTVLHRPLNWVSTKMDDLGGRFPPYSDQATDQAIGMLKKPLPRPSRFPQWLISISVAVTGVFFGIFGYARGK
ncbi:hypothetical protein M427DRAFT_57463 [Gonapodya prolifera JEL478]|uniref:Aldehyde dehydrogenase n=1 Tax=Gonapodya prolifera (strain JEL478) TaxID=1344416 RepID=A0A139ACQ6_GONPJ|nr:hypothetical protein M427DRAFT_57463 [Gonapodya prolifera JEL478]|eukprot:KXS14550.1 hypothetical protein M427DRAFT_57463 [Gonapodya prolifera JEL478]